MLIRTSKYILLTFIGDYTDPKARISWESIDNSIYKLDEQSLTVSVHSYVKEVYTDID
jgi:hypothetical protein